MPTLKVELKSELEELESNAAREEFDPAEGQESEAPFIYSVTAQTPWWIVSIMLHALVIALAGLVSMAIEMPGAGEPSLTVTEFLRPAQPELKQVKLADSEILNKPSVPMRELEKNGQVDIVVPIDQIIELSDRFRTDNHGDDPDGCWGDPSCKVFDPVGRLDQSGGGGTGALEALVDMPVGCGMGSFGSGGGSGGGSGSGIGTGRGNGCGTFGSRTKGNRATRARTGGGGPLTEGCVEKSLRWLAYHQDPDGHWDSRKFDGLKVDTANTGLALLAFLGAGHTEKVGEYRDNVKRAVQWLKSKQAASGLIYDTSDAGGHRGTGYPHAIATMALAEAAGMANLPETKAAAQKAVDYAVRLHQCGEGSEKLGFRYQAKQPGDLSVTGWFTMALKSAKVAGLKVDHTAFEGVIAFIDSVEKKGAAQDDYGPASRFAYMPGSHVNHRLGAIGNLCRQFMGWKKEELQGSVGLFMKDGGVPSWGANGEAVDMYYWYYGSLCVYQQGGDLWQQWNAGMVKSLCENQRGKGDEAGSWDPKGPYSGEWGRVGQTALGCLCLEVYYRYERQLR